MANNLLKKGFLLILFLVILSLRGLGQIDALTITGNNVNLRESPSSTAKIIKKLDFPNTASIIDKGKLEKIGEKTDYWYNINYNGSKGWVFGAFTSLAQGSFAIEGNYEDCWFSDQTGEGRCNYKMEITKEGEIFMGIIWQGIPDSYEGELFPEQTLTNFKVLDLKEGMVSFSFNRCMAYAENEKETEYVWEEVKAEGLITAKAISFNISGESGYRELAILIRK